MESMGSKRQRPRRSFTPEFKAEIVELCQRGDRSIGQVARDFDLTVTAVREWVKQAERDAGTRVDGGMTSAERARVGRPATNNVEAYQLYLQGRHCMHRFTEQGIRQAISYFERAAALRDRIGQLRDSIGQKLSEVKVQSYKPGPKSRRHKGGSKIPRPKKAR